MFQRLHARLSAGYIALMAIVFLLLGLYLTSYVENIQRDELQARLHAQAWLIAEAVDILLVNDQAELVDGLVHRSADEIDARVTVIDQTGHVLGDSEADHNVMENHAERPEMRTALAGQVGEASRESTTLNRSLMYVAVPILEDGTVVGAARVAMPSDQFAGWLRHIVLAISAALLIAAIAIAALSTVLARIITRPLAELVHAANQVAAGNLTIRAKETGGGEVAELAHAFNEMTDELQATIGAIETERARLKVIVEHLTDGILLVSKDGRVVLMNGVAERLLNVQRSRAIGQPYALAVRDHELAALITRARTANGTTEPGTEQLIEFGSPRRYIRAFTHPTPDQETPQVVILRDITEVRRTEAVRRDFVANVSHELRTPIASLKALVETLLDGAMDDEEVARDFLERMEIEVDGLAALVHDLLELSRAESGRMTLTPIDASIHDVAHQVLERLRTQADPRRIDLRLAIPADLPPAHFDPERIEQVLVNLIHNALKFTPAGGTITIGAEVDGPHLIVSVTDTGAGIAEEDHHRIFERFYKADRARADEGTGLGLAIAKHLVELHGGRIWVESMLGHGSTFKFTLPLTADEAPPPVAPADQKP